MLTIDEVFDKLFDFYNVGTISDLAEKINTPQSTISKWRQRSSINAVKRKARELNIYNDIFNVGDGSVGKIAGQNNIGIQHQSKLANTFLFEKEYKKIETLADMGGEEGIHDLENKLSELKKYLTKYV